MRHAGDRATCGSPWSTTTWFSRSRTTAAGGPAPHPGGVGHRSMVERAEELGGSVVVSGRHASRNAGPRDAAAAPGRCLSRCASCVADDHPVYRDGHPTLLARSTASSWWARRRTATRRSAWRRSSTPDVYSWTSACPAQRDRGHPGDHAASGPHRRAGADDVRGRRLGLRAMRAGARGYLLKDADREELARAIDAIGHGGAIFGAGVARRVQSFFLSADHRITPFPDLTARELEVLDRIARGEANPTHRPAPRDQPEDSAQPREHDPRQAHGRRPLAGHRPCPGGRARDRAEAARLHGSHRARP